MIKYLKLRSNFYSDTIFIYRTLISYNTMIVNCTIKWSFEYIKLNVLISSQSTIRHGAKLSKCGDGWLQLWCVYVCVYIYLAGESSGGGNGLYVHGRDISKKQNATNIIVMVLSVNDTSKWSILLWYCWTFPSNAENITRQPTRVTGKVILSATLVHYKSQTYVSLHQAISTSAYALYAHNSYIGIIDYRYIILHILYIINAFA